MNYQCIVLFAQHDRLNQCIVYGTSSKWDHSYDIGKIESSWQPISVRCSYTKLLRSIIRCIPSNVYGGWGEFKEGRSEFKEGRERSLGIISSS